MLASSCEYIPEDATETRRGGGLMRLRKEHKAMRTAPPSYLLGGTRWLGHGVWEGNSSLLQVRAGGHRRR